MSEANGATSAQTHPQPSKLRVIAIRTVLVLILVSLGGAFFVMVYGTLSTNRITKAMRDFDSGTPISTVIEKYGEPDQVDPVDGTWKWKRRLKRTPESVKSVAVYWRNITPQVCSYLLDGDDRIVEIEVFASY